jgi:hypothetical protein
MEDGVLKVVTGDDCHLNVDIRLSKCCELLHSIVEDNGVEEEIILSRVTQRALEWIIRYYESHGYVSPALIEKPLVTPLKDILLEAQRGTDLEFTEGLINDLSLLGELLTAADYLDAKGCLSVLCAYVADRFRDKSWEQIKDEFQLEGEFGYAEKEELKEEFPWLQEDS